MQSNPEQMKTLITELKRDYDYILIDCPAGIEQGFKNAIAGADRAIVVTTPEISAVRDADRIIGLLEQEDIEPPKLIINRIKRHLMNNGDALDVNDITSHLSIDLLGIVLDDENVISSSNKGEPVVMDPSNPAAIGYRNIARRILGESVPLMSIDTGKPGFFGKLKQFSQNNTKTPNAYLMHRGFLWIFKSYAELHVVTYSDPKSNFTIPKYSHHSSYTKKNGWCDR